ncbi:MAG TPA: SDR family oxidoreductase [Brevefilum sp.]|nr:SDR family oxidoreductase [Brevefilum sp.]HOR18641.1 SDR family oxidoreductase [Brevefilum sp.]HPL68831.1 SDR family oxidoreductase [Brevefilum sp.]
MQHLFRRLLQLLWVPLALNAYKLALITGGSSGIGFALAKALVAQGSDVCLLARSQDTLDDAKQALTESLVREDQQVHLISSDVTDYSSLSRVLNQWVQVYGCPDLVINSAGITYPGYFNELDIDVFRRLMDVNYFGTLYVSKILVPGMIGRGSGTIVNISSQAGFISIFGYSGYSASKFAVRALSEAMRAELKQHGIRVAIVFPPDTQTPQLEFEEPLKPIETRAISSQSGVLTAKQVADSTLTGLKKGNFIILPGLEGKLFYRLVNLFGNLQYPILDWMVKRARKKA